MFKTQEPGWLSFKLYEGWESNELSYLEDPLLGRFQPLFLFLLPLADNKPAATITSVISDNGVIFKCLQ